MIWRFIILLLEFSFFFNTQTGPHQCWTLRLSSKSRLTFQLPIPLSRFIQWIKMSQKIRFLYSTTEFYCIIWNGYPEIGLLKVESDLGRRNIPRFSSTLTKHRNIYEYRKNKQQWEFQEMQRPELEARRSHKGGGLNFYSVFIWQKIILFCLNCEIFWGWESKRKKKMAKPKAKQTATAWGGDPTLVWLDVDDQIVLLLYFYHIILFQFFLLRSVLVKLIIGFVRFNKQ